MSVLAMDYSPRMYVRNVMAGRGEMIRVVIVMKGHRGVMSAGMVGRVRGRSFTWRQ